MLNTPCRSGEPADRKLHILAPVLVKMNTLSLFFFTFEVLLKLSDIYFYLSVNYCYQDTVFFCFGTAAWTRSQILVNWDNKEELWRPGGGFSPTGWTVHEQNVSACLSGLRRVSFLVFFSSISNYCCWLLALLYMWISQQCFPFLAVQIFDSVCSSVLCGSKCLTLPHLKVCLIFCRIESTIWWLDVAKYRRQSFSCKTV